MSPLALVALSVPLAACSLDDATERLRLNDRQFLLQAAEGAPQLSGVKVRLGFSGLELHFSGNCNQHFGKYRLRDGQLVLQELGQTEMGCGAEESGRDELLERFFLARPRFVLEGNKLTLTSRGVRLSFLDRVVADPDRPLRATPWGVSDYTESEGMMGLMGITAPVLVFNHDGSWTLRATCCDGTGRYELSDGRVAITSAEFKPLPCSKENDQVAARFVRSVLTDGELRYRIKAGHLTLESDKRGLGLHDTR